MADQIEGKVAQILDEFTLIINVGQTKGVKPGMEFVVYAPGDDVTDPDTGASLGAWEVVKGRVVASHVQEKLTICHAASAKQEEDTSDPRTRTLSAAMIADHMRAKSGTQALNVNKAQLRGMPKTGPISVGDRVRCEA